MGYFTRDRPYRQTQEIIYCMTVTNVHTRKRGFKMFSELNKKGNLFDFVPDDKDKFIGTIEYYETVLKGDNSDKESAVIPCHGCFFFDTVNGDSGAMILPECNVYIPKHLLSTFRQICDNPEQVQAIKEGKLGVTFHRYDSKKRKNCVGVDLVDIDG